MKAWESLLYLDEMWFNSYRDSRWEYFIRLAFVGSGDHRFYYVIGKDIHREIFNADTVDYFEKIIVPELLENDKKNQDRDIIATILNNGQSTTY